MSTFLNFNIYLSLKIVLILENSADPALCNITPVSSLFAKVFVSRMKMVKTLAFTSCIYIISSTSSFAINVMIF